MNKLNERIKHLRKYLQLTQQEFADKLGIKRNTLATYESGRNQPIDAVVNLICITYKVNEEWLRTGSGKMFKASSTDALNALANEYNLSRGAFIAVEKFVKLNPNTQTEILNYFTEVVNALQNNSIPKDSLKTN